MIFCAFRRPNMFICPDMYLNNTPFRDRYIQAANCMLSEQFIFGTSYPFMPMKEGYDLFMDMNISGNGPGMETYRDDGLYVRCVRSG